MALCLHRYFISSPYPPTPAISQVVCYLILTPNPGEEHMIPILQMRPSRLQAVKLRAIYLNYTEESS